MSFIQDEFNKAGGSFVLTPGEYEWPLIVDRPCVIDGKNSTLWADRGPVLVVDAEGVVLKNLRIEVTGKNTTGMPDTSLRLTRSDTQLENIEINGKAEGLKEEPADWSLPTVIALGDFAANKENSFSIELDAPRAAELVHNLKDVAITPDRIRQGRNTINITTSNMRDNTILFGEMLVKTSVSRRIYITGKAKKGAEEHIASTPVSSVPPSSEPVQMDAPLNIPAPLQEESGPGVLVNRGQRLPLGQLQQGQLTIVYSHKSCSRQMDIDPYVFLLGKNGKVRSDKDLIFFGNEESEDKAVRTKTDAGAGIAAVSLDKICAETEKLAVCLSVYEDQSGSTFSDVQEPMIRVLSGNKERFRFLMDGLSQEKTVVAVEIYRYKGEWKINFVGGGFRQGLEALCRSYGVEVE